MYSKEQLFTLFDELGIVHTTKEHEEVLTVSAMLPQVGELPGVVSKNLFLKDKKKRLFLLSCRHDRQVDLAQVARLVGAASGALRLAPADSLQQHLGVTQGCVTAFALVNDSTNAVHFLLDDCMLDGDQSELVYFHPLTNDATTGVSKAHFKKFLQHIKHPPTPITF